MPKTTSRGRAKQSELPETLRRSPAKAQRTFAKAHDSAVREYGEGHRAQVPVALLEPVPVSGGRFADSGNDMTIDGNGRPNGGPHSPQAERPLGGYVVLSSAFGVMATSFCVWVRRSGREFPERVALG